MKPLLLAALLLLMIPMHALAHRWHQQGYATWFTGTHGACTPKFPKMYAASKTEPCGTKLHVTYKGHHADVIVADRGPQNGLIDLAPRAFKRLAPLSRGRIWVRVVKRS